MDGEYAELSIKCGVFCGAADAFLDSDYFSTKVRAARWELTPKLFEE